MLGTGRFNCSRSSHRLNQRLKMARKSHRVATEISDSVDQLSATNLGNVGPSPNPQPLESESVADVTQTSSPSFRTLTYPEPAAQRTAKKPARTAESPAEYK